MRHRLWGADRIRFRIQGRDPQRYINRVISQGVQLDHIQWETNGCIAQGFGRDYATLHTMAVQGKWQFSVLQRHGPGHFGEAAIARPGLIVGVILFILLLNLLHRFVWVIDFGALEGDVSERMRILLEECGIYEGVLLQEDALENAQTLALQQSDLFGWVSLNFTGGCLFVESTEAQDQMIKSEPELRPLYAKTGGVVTAVQAESGFACVVPGQTVTEGQLLVDTVRLDRDGREISQGASGKILAECEMTFSASEELEQTSAVLEPEKFSKNTLYFLGGTWHFQSHENHTAGDSAIEWLPLRFGRLSLPGCICSETVWKREVQTIYYTPKQAEALARRDCRRQLLDTFPDAEILAERCVLQTASDSVTAEVTYQFCANIAFSQQ